MVSALALFNEVNRHWAWLLLGWVTVYGQVNHPSRSPVTEVYSAFYPPWDGNMSISFWAEYNKIMTMVDAVFYLAASREPGELSQ